MPEARGGIGLQAIRFHYHPARYLLTRLLARRRPGMVFGPAGCVRLEKTSPLRLPGDAWVRIETTISGICGSDLSAITAHDSFALEPFAAFPFTFGHENVGRIVELGGAVDGWQEGQRVIVNPMLACRQRGIDPPCAPCARGSYGFCRNTNEGVIGRGPMIGYCPATGGGWSSEFVAHASQLHAAGDIPDEVAVLTDPLASALRPVLLHPPVAGDVVLVIGAGTIGALTILSLRTTGWTGPIAVLGRHAFQRDFARRAGADTILGTRDELHAWAASLPGARAYRPSLAPPFVEGGPSLVYDTVGSASSAQDGLSLTREEGRYVLVGSAAKIGSDWTRLWYRQLTMTGVFAYGPAPWKDGVTDIYQAAIQVLEDGDVGRLAIVTHTFPLGAYRQAVLAALQKPRHHSVKVVFRPEQNQQ